MARRALPAFVAALLAGASTSVAAQRPSDAPTYFATILTPTGALPPLVLPAPVGAPRLGVGLDVLYGYGELVGQRRLSLHTVGASVELTILAAHLSVRGTGAYLVPDCGRVMHCDGYPMAGASAALRVASWNVDDALTPGLATLSLNADGGIGYPDGGRAESAAAGLTVTLIGTSGTLRVVAFGTPQVVWGRLRIDDPVAFNQQFGSVLSLDDAAFEESGIRYLVGGGIAVLSTHTGLGLHLGVQHVLVHGARTRVGVSVTWRSRG
jgi:hypothetical protein